MRQTINIYWDSVHTIQYIELSEQNKLYLGLSTTSIRGVFVSTFADGTSDFVSIL
jgi:hypothetical protein